MSEENNLSQNAPHSSSSNHSSKWSISTSNLGKETHCTNSVTNYDSKRQRSRKRRCAPFRKFFKSIFHHHHNRRKLSILESEESTVTENTSFQHGLFIKFQEHISLLDAFINTSLILKLKTFSELCCFSPICSARSSEFSLPAAEVWMATYLLKLMKEHRESVNLQPYRKLFMSLFWDMEMTKKIGMKFYMKFSEYFSVINVTLKELRGVLFSYSAPFVSEIKNGLSMPDPLDLNIRSHSGREKPPLIALQIIPSFSPDLPFSFTVMEASKKDKNESGPLPQINLKDFLDLNGAQQEHIIQDLLKSAMKLLESGKTVMESSFDRICSKGIIITGAIPSKDVTCYTTIKAAKHLLEKLIFKRRRGLKLNDTDENELKLSFLNLFQSWRTYVELGQNVLRIFFELCDMISISYSFALHQIQLNVLEVTTLQKEVELAIVAHNKKICRLKCPCGLSNLKTYAMTTFLKECEDNPVEGSKQWGEFYGRLMTSTRYHLLLHQYPLELDDGYRKYTIILRSQPDLERVESGMILKIKSAILTLPGDKGDFKNVISFNIFENAQVQTFSIK